MAAHLHAGREHLLTEDVLRFSLARAPEDVGVDPGRLQVEHRVADIGAIDLVVDTPPTAAIEIKYPRDAEGSGAGDTMFHGELLAGPAGLAHAGSAGGHSSTPKAPPLPPTPRGPLVGRFHRDQRQPAVDAAECEPQRAGFLAAVDDGGGAEGVLADERLVDAADGQRAGDRLAEVSRCQTRHQPR